MATDLFMKAFDSHCNGCERTCACGIHWFDVYNISDYEEGELEALLEKAKADPEKYKETDGSVGTIEIDSIEIVWNCTCNHAERYENFIISHAGQIAEYLNKRAVMLREQADEIQVKEVNTKDEG